MARKNQRRMEGQGSGEGSDFSRQVDSGLCRRMKAEHSLQTDHSGQSFRQSEQSNADETLEDRMDRQEAKADRRSAWRDSGGSGQSEA